MQQRIVGIDEVGRGALAGPVLVGAVILSDHDLTRAGLAEVLGRQPADSKQLTAAQRDRGNGWLREQVQWAVGRAEAAEINEWGIVVATSMAAGRALALLEDDFDIVHADAGLFHPQEERYPTERFVNGDENILSILCASLIAKVERDNLMIALHAHHPLYGWARNKGYGSLEHRVALRSHGASPLHRDLFIRRSLMDAA